jgi:precorrin-3B synthase
VPARDGGICRVRLAGGRVAVQQALVLADVAARCGSGVLEITNRANVQVRGVKPAHAAMLIENLLAAGLGPTVPGADDVRNLLSSPTAAIDVSALLDVEPLAEDILELLQARTDLHRLDPKFALQLDGGERAAMLEHPHDLWLAALPDGGHFAFGLAGCPPLAASAAPALAAVPAHAALELVEAVLLQFLECARPEQTRMRHLLTTLPATEFLARLQARLSFPLRIDAALLQWRRPAPAVDAHIGIHAQRERGLCYVAAVPTLGRIDSAQLRALAALAQEYGGELRFTPWQSVLLANIAEAAAPRLAGELQSVGLCCDAFSVLAHTIACSGANGCAKGLADTKNDARQLSELLQRRIDARPGENAMPSVHLTGCERSCAAAHSADFTLLAQAPGRYAMYRRAEGHTGFGCMLAQSIDIETAAELIENACLVRDFNHDSEVDA